MFKRFIEFITFVNLPIRKKFILFSVGTLFWFVTMFAISIVTNSYVNDNTNRIVHHAIPLDRITQKIKRKFQDLSIDASETMNIPNTKVLDRKIELSKAKILDIRSFISVLSHGGQVYDINRNTNEFIESFTVIPINGKLEKEYANNLLPLMDTLDIKMAELADLKINILNHNVQDDGRLAKKIHELKQLLYASISLSNELTAKITKVYAINSKNIRYAIRFNFYAFASVLLIATFLLGIFTISISKSLANPVKAIIEQIRSLGEGKVDLSKKIKVRSKDEIGILTEDLNNLMEEIQDLTIFKKVIEEDDSLEDVYSRLGNIINEKFGLDEFIIYEVSNSQNKMKPVYPIILNDDEIFCNTDILHNSNLCKVKKTGHTISSIEYFNICKQFRTDIEKVHICIPMIIGGSAGGVVQFLLDYKYKNASIDRKDRRIFKAEQYIKESLSVIEAKRLTNTLKESALKDALTGLYNRRFLQEYTETLIAGVLRRKKILGLIMCDLDYFKQINDVYGHNVGDAVLKETSDVIQKCVRASDLLIRFGGEEFLVLMIDINEGETSGLAEKIREAMENTKIKVSDGIITKTISMGTSEFPIDTESFWQAIKFADVALYKAKETGRNKVVRFTKEMWTEEQF